MSCLVPKKELFMSSIFMKQPTRKMEVGIEVGKRIGGWGRGVLGSGVETRDSQD